MPGVPAPPRNDPREQQELESVFDPRAPRPPVQGSSVVDNNLFRPDFVDLPTQPDYRIQSEKVGSRRREERLPGGEIPARSTSNRKRGARTERHARASSNPPLRAVKEEFQEVFSPCPRGGGGGCVDVDPRDSVRPSTTKIRCCPNRPDFSSARVGLFPPFLAFQKTLEASGSIECGHRGRSFSARTDLRRCPPGIPAYIPGGGSMKRRDGVAETVISPAHTHRNSRVSLSSLATKGLVLTTAHPSPREARGPKSKPARDRSPVCFQALGGGLRRILDPVRKRRHGAG